MTIAALVLRELCWPIRWNHAAEKQIDFIPRKRNRKSLSGSRSVYVGRSDLDDHPFFRELNILELEISFEQHFALPVLSSWLYG